MDFDTPYTETGRQRYQARWYSSQGVLLLYRHTWGWAQHLPFNPQKISGISSTPKKYLKFWQPQKYSRFCTLTLKNDPKIHKKWQLNIVKFCDDPKNIHKIFLPPKIYFFSEKTQIILKCKILTHPPKNDPSLRMYENIRVPPTPLEYS